MTADKIDADFPHFPRSRSTLVERKLGEGNRVEVRYDSVRLWHHKTVDGPMDHKLDERTKSPICLHSSSTNRPVPGVLKLNKTTMRATNLDFILWKMAHRKETRSCRQYWIGKLGYQLCPSRPTRCRHSCASEPSPRTLRSFRKEGSCPRLV